MSRRTRRTTIQMSELLVTSVNGQSKRMHTADATSIMTFVSVDERYVR